MIIIAEKYIRRHVHTSKDRVSKEKILSNIDRGAMPIKELMKKYGHK